MVDFKIDCVDQSFNYIQNRDDYLFQYTLQFFHILKKKPNSSTRTNRCHA